MKQIPKDSSGWLDQTGCCSRWQGGLEKLEALAAKPGNGYDEQTGLIFTEIPMERGESLHIDLELKEGDKRYEIRSWYVYDSGEYEIDDTVKVWDGKDRSGT